MKNGTADMGTSKSLKGRLPFLAVKLGGSN
jgi:hypothetical protein